MARISGVNIPTAKKIHIALTYIFGIGPKIAKDLCTQASIDKAVGVFFYNPIRIIINISLQI